MVSKIALDTPTWLKIASDKHPREFKAALRRFLVPSEPFKDPPKRPKLLPNRWTINEFCLLVVSLPMGS
eukprot:8460188-Pyramimonas_sp.AAC.1